MFLGRKIQRQNILSFTDYINNFIDHSKAFDTLDQSTLIEKLDASEVRSTLFRWSEDYLRESSYYVRIGSACRGAVKVTVGIAQFSVMGPLHYYVNVIKKCTVFQCLCKNKCTRF